MPSSRSELLTKTIVGVDGSPASMHALKWAAAWSDYLGAVQAVLAWSHRPWAGGNHETAAQAAQARLAAVVDAHDDLPLVDPVVRAGKAGLVLSDLGSTEGTAIVLGTRSRGALRDGLFGSVGQFAIAHATVPVIVVPPAAALACPAKRMIVGVDDSDNSLAALRFANQITPSNQSIEVVHSWYYFPREIPNYKPGALGPVEAKEAETLRRAIDRFRDEVEVGDNRLVPSFEYGDPRRVLAEKAGPNDILVVGARGLNGVPGLVLGSVAAAVTHQPRGTTIVVPPVPV